MEVAKGVIFDRGETELNGKKCHAYLVGIVLVTDQPLSKVNGNETIVMGANQFQNLLTEGLEGLKKYQPPFHLGDLSHAILTVSDMNPNDLEPV